MQDLKTGSMPPPVQSITPEDTAVGTFRLIGFSIGGDWKARPKRRCRASGFKVRVCIVVRLKRGAGYESRIYLRNKGRQSVEGRDYP
jgi:hypothetical protein